MLVVLLLQLEGVAIKEDINFKIVGVLLLGGSSTNESVLIYLKMI